MSSKPIAGQLLDANQALYEAILPAIKDYEELTGLRIEEIAVDRPFAGVGYHRPIQGIKVRTNASNL